MARTLINLILLGCAVLLMQTGCSDQETPPPPASEKPVSRLHVPDNVQGQWQAVRIAVFDKKNSQNMIHTIDLGGELQIPDTSVRLRVDHFLPAFVIQNKILTSASNEPTNPAVQLTVTESGRQIYQGWLFQNYPNTHAFQHPRFSFTLVAAIKATKKKS